MLCLWVGGHSCHHRLHVRETHLAILRASLRYSPGTIMCAVVVPAFIIHAQPAAALSGKPVVAVVAPGKATVMWCRISSLSVP